MFSSNSISSLWLGFLWRISKKVYYYVQKSDSKTKRVMSTDTSGGGLDLESVYKAAVPISREDSDLTRSVNEAEDAPLMLNIN